MHSKLGVARVFVVVSAVVFGSSSIAFGLSLSNPDTGQSVTVNGNSWSISGGAGNNASGTIPDGEFSDGEGNPITLEQYLEDLLEESEYPDIELGDMPDDWENDPDGQVYKTYYRETASYTRSTQGEDCVTVETVHFEIRYKLQKIDGEYYLVQYIQAFKSTITLCGEPLEQISSHMTVAELPTGNKKKVS